MTEIEQTSQKMIIWNVINDRTITSKTSKEVYTFDQVFQSNITTEEIFDYDIKPMIANSLKGYNVTVLAYGQTSSGKTFTINGGQDSTGLIKLAARGLFRGIESLK